MNLLNRRNAGLSDQLWMACLAILIMTIPLAAQNSWGKEDFVMSAGELAAAVLPGPLPTGEFSQLTMTLLPVYATPHRLSHNWPHPVLTARWWISPNLALSSAMGSSAWNGQLVHSLRVGVSYLPAVAEGRNYLPEITVARGLVKGLDPYSLRWNEFRLILIREIGSLTFGAGVALIYQTIFTNTAYRMEDVPGKLEATERTLLVSGGYDARSWLRLSARLFVSRNLLSSGIQVSVAI